MTCTEIRLLLHADADGELDVAHSLELEHHLKTCAACAAEKNNLGSLKTRLKQPSLQYRAPESFKKNVREMFRAAETEARAPRINSLQLWRWLAFGATGFALLALLVRPAGISERDQLLDEAIASHVRSLMAEHLTDVASSDQHTVKPWFNGKLDFAPDVKDFAAQGFPLIGGRLDYFNGRAVAALVYRHNKHFINVFIWPATGGQESTTENRRGYSVLDRDANGLHFCLVSDLNPAELGELAGLLAR